MTNIPAAPVPIWWGSVNTAPQVIDVCTHQPVPPPEVSCCAERLLYPFSPPQLIWTINHNRGKTPASVAVISTSGIVTTSRVQHTSINQVVISHVQAYEGYAILLV